MSEDLKAIAIETLLGVAGDCDAPAAARAAAARTLLEMLGEVGRLQEKSVAGTGGKPIIEMTATELDLELERLASIVARDPAPRARRTRSPYRLL
jgi:hypothetical protein